MRWWILAGVLATSVAHAEPTVEELLMATDDIARGESSIAVVEMQVKTARYERSMKMQAWSRGTDQSLIRILEPAKDAGVSTLKVGDNIWNYLPKVDRTMKVPAGMMSGSWMGSHFSNDDLVRDSRLSEDYTASITQRPDENEEKAYVIEAIPKPDAAVVWGKVVARITPEKIPLDVRYYAEDGTLARTMSFGEVRTFDGRAVPSTMTLLPADKPDEYTKMIYVSLDFDADVPESTFSQQALRQ